MTKEDIDYQLNLSYEDQCKYLKIKYGEVPGNYYIDDSYKYQNQSIKKGQEGLEIHHIKEKDEMDLLSANLSDPFYAKQKPYECQWFENLCYCNYLEHLILHIKINIWRTEVLGTYYPDAVELIMLNRLDRIYEGLDVSSLERNALEPIKENYSDYIRLSNYWVKEIKKFKKVFDN